MIIFKKIIKSKAIIFANGLLGILFLLACTTSAKNGNFNLFSTAKNIDYFKQGMTSEDVKKLLGEPNEVIKEQTSDTFVYSKNPELFNAVHFNFDKNKNLSEVKWIQLANYYDNIDKLSKIFPEATFKEEKKLKDYGHYFLYLVNLSDAKKGIYAYQNEDSVLTITKKILSSDNRNLGSSKK